MTKASVAEENSPAALVKIVEEINLILPTKPCLVVKEACCAFEFQINSNSTIITPNGGQQTSCSDLSQLGYTLNGF